MPTVTVNDELLQAADRLYDAVDETLRILACSPPHRLLALDGLQAKLRHAHQLYDDAIAREPAEVSHVA